MEMVKLLVVGMYGFLLDLAGARYEITSTQVAIIATKKFDFTVSFRLGATFDKNTKRDPKFKWLCPYPSWLVPKKLMILAYMSKFFDQLRYGKDWAFEDVPNATKFYNGLSLTVSSKARGLGLGSELIQRTNVYAKKWNCSHVYIGASSKYSQAIFKKIGFDVLHEAQYSGFKGKDGTDLFKDMREHKVCQVVLLDLKNVSETF